MRKNLLSVKSDAPAQTVSGPVGDYARRGASRSMMLSIDEMAENAKRAISGEAIVDLDPGLVDPSFLRDRVEDDPESYAQLKQSVETQGQLQPVLVRTHPDAPGRYMIVFGHRRARVARDLGVPLRAVVKDIEEINHVIVQGQENSRRADLTYIERCLLARKLMEMSHSKETIKNALGIDDTTLSRMLSVVSTIPLAVLTGIGSAKGVGRDRWEALKKLLLNPKHAKAALERVDTKAFQALRGALRFDDVLASVAKSRKPKARPAGGAVRLESKSGQFLAEMRASRRDVKLTLPSADAVPFAQFLGQRLPALFEEYTRNRHEE